MIGRAGLAQFGRMISRFIVQSRHLLSSRPIQFSGRIGESRAVGIDVEQEQIGVSHRQVRGIGGRQAQFGGRPGNRVAVWLMQPELRDELK